MTDDKIIRAAADAIAVYRHSRRSRSTWVEAEAIVAAVEPLIRAAVQAESITDEHIITTVANSPEFANAILSTPEGRAAIDYVKQRYSQPMAIGHGHGYLDPADDQDGDQ